MVQLSGAGALVLGPFVAQSAAFFMVAMVIVLIQLVNDIACNFIVDDLVIPFFEYAFHAGTKFAGVILSFGNSTIRLVLLFEVKIDIAILPDHNRFMRRAGTGNSMPGLKLSFADEG